MHSAALLTTCSTRITSQASAAGLVCCSTTRNFAEHAADHRQLPHAIPSPAEHDAAHMLNPPPTQSATPSHGLALPTALP